MSISLVRLMNEIERKDMPQVRGKDLPEMLKTFRDNGIAYRKGKVAVNYLKPTQEDGIPSKVDAIVSTIERGIPLSPIVISRDDYILDGHHRWIAYKKVFGDDLNVQMDCIVIDRPKWDALRMFDKVADEVA